MIVADSLYKKLNDLQVLKGASIEVDEGESVAIIGGSGTGKTVFLKHLAGLMQPDEGRVLLDGEDLCCLRGKELENLRRHIGFLFQGGALFESMTVYDNVAFPLRERTDLSEAEIDERVRGELDSVGLDGSSAKYPAEISGGMAKRVALARALVQSPKIMLFDEPTTGLDPVIARSIHELIRSVRERLDLTAVIVTHEIPAIFEIVDKVVMLHEGVTRFSGTPMEIMETDDPVVEEFTQKSVCPREFCIHRRPT